MHKLSLQGLIGPLLPTSHTSLKAGPAVITGSVDNRPFAALAGLLVFQQISLNSLVML